MASDEKQKSTIELQRELDLVKEALIARGMNITGASDIFGRRFNLPVDAEHKATVFNLSILLSCANPFQRGFWASTVGFFSTFFSTFAAAPLMVYIKKPEALDLVKADIMYSNIASVAGTIFMRLVTGYMCDKLGARKAFVSLLWLGIPGIIGIAFTTEANGFIICRFIIGLSLAAFVACQVWNSQLFTKSVVGSANAAAGGWGNLGGGITNLVMPFIMLGFLSATDENLDLSWRLCYIVPLIMHIGSGLLVLTGRDLPDGNYAELESSGAKSKADGSVIVKLGLSNINAWILVIQYGFCFGVELTMTNVAALYFHSYHGLTPQVAGLMAATFGLMNLFARSWGGILSDNANVKYGMRGRLWAFWITQMIEGAFCILLGVVTIQHDSPDSGLPREIATFKEGGVLYMLSEDHKNYRIGGCASADIEAPDTSMVFLYPDGNVSVGDSLDLPKRLLIGDNTNQDCIRNADLDGLALIVMIFFSITVQMSEGLTFGIVPYVSKPALGIVSGMVGAGGNAGAVITLWAIFKNPEIDRTDTGFVVLGVTVIVLSLLQHFIYFPDSGGMLFKAGSLKYDPQRVKPPKGYRGSEVNFNVDVCNTKTTPETVTNSA